MISVPTHPLPIAMTATQPLIQLHDIGKVLPQRREMGTATLANINLAIWPGDFVWIEGPLGSGKSTLLSILGLATMPSTGRYLFGGKDVFADEATRQACREVIGFISSGARLDDSPTAHENLSARLTPTNVATHECRARVDAVLARVDLRDLAGATPSQLSPAQGIRAVLASALILRPSILLADDPFTNLEAKDRCELINDLVRLRRDGLALCVATRDRWTVEEARQFRMHAGQLSPKYAESMWWI